MPSAVTVPNSCLTTAASPGSRSKMIRNSCCNILPLAADCANCRPTSPTSCAELPVNVAARPNCLNNRSALAALTPTACKLSDPAAADFRSSVVCVSFTMFSKDLNCLVPSAADPDTAAKPFSSLSKSAKVLTAAPPMARMGNDTRVDKSLPIRSALKLNFFSWFSARLRDCAKADKSAPIRITRLDAIISTLLG